jgi:hypothetical protein
MSTPKNHHYVSQRHIKNFFNKERRQIFYYDKELDRFGSKLTTKSIFSEDFSNSRVIDGEVDHKALEDDLNIHFENDFERNYLAVKAIIANPNLFSVHQAALESLTKLAIASILRHPSDKANFDNQINDQLMEKVYPDATPELKAWLDNMFDDLSKVKYSNAVGYSEISDGVFDLMGRISYTIIEIDTFDYFLLPDRYAITHRVMENPESSLNHVVALVGIPLSSKIFLTTASERLGLEKGNRVLKISDNKRDIIKKINDELYEGTVKTIACESEDYLYSFINGELY